MIKVYDLILFYRNYDGDMLWVFHKLTMSPTFWLLTILVLLICMIPDLLIMIHNTYIPLKLNKNTTNFNFEERFNEAHLSTPQTPFPVKK